jgi:hypothetical protein
MESTINKLKADISSGPLGAIVGGTLGYLLAKNFGYDKTLTVVSFVVVGGLTGAILTSKIK